jgi:hypothetical protein
MEITFIGYIFLFVYIIGIFLPVKYLIAFVIFSCIFQSTAIINITGVEKGVMPYAVASIFLILKSVLTRTLVLDIKHDSFVRLVTIFMLFSVTASIILPIIWDGIRIHNELRAALYAGLKGEQLHFSIRNTAQCCYAIVNLLAICCIHKNCSRIANAFIVKTFVFAVVTVLIIGFWEFTAKTTQKISFPYLFIYNNVGYTQGYLQLALDGIMRLNSLFLEPSYCGAFLSASFWAMISIDSKKAKALCLVIGLALILNLSGTGMMSFLAGFILYSFVCSRKILWFALLLIPLALIISEMGYAGYISEMLTTKTTSTSGKVRGEAASFAWDLFLHTKGLGIGLGSFRGSSFILDMLVGLGVIGVLLFYRIYSHLLKSLMADQHVWLFVFGIVLLIAQCLAIPDFAFSIMWMFLFMATAILPKNILDRTNMISCNNRLAYEQDREYCHSK